MCLSLFNVNSKMKIYFPGGNGVTGAGAVVLHAKTPVAGAETMTASIIGGGGSGDCQGKRRL